VAVTVAVWFAETVSLAALNVAVLLPDATVTDAGTVRAVELEDSVTVAPVEPAAALN
jgi:hypothetical protein